MTLREHDEIVRIGDMLIEKVTKALREAAIIKNSKCKNFVKNICWSFTEYRPRNNKRHCDWHNKPRYGCKVPSRPLR